jgi:hypothetical protein
VSLHRDLRQEKERQALADDLEDILRDGLQLAPRPGATSAVDGVACGGPSAAGGNGRGVNAGTREGSC